MSDRQITLFSKANGTKVFSVIFPYNEKLVEFVKKIPTREFKNNSWYINADHITAKYIEAFSRKLDFELDDNAKKFIEDANSPVSDELEILNFKGILRDFQKIGVNYAIKYERCFIADEQGLGKAQSLFSKILTPIGWKLMKDIVVGDEIINYEGNISHVTGVYPQGLQDAYEVKFNDKAKTITCGEHLWAIQTANDIHRNSKFRIKKLNDFKNNLKYKWGSKFYLPMVKPINFSETELYINPYIMGVLLGDGGIKYRVTVTMSDINIVNEVIKNLAPDVKLNKSNYSKIEYRIINNNGKPGTPNKYIDELKKLGLFGKGSSDKFIPNSYKFNSIENRLSLLQGLLDTDGHIEKNGSIVEYYTTSERLCEDVKFIVQSLGGNAKQFTSIPTYIYKNVKKTGKMCYILRIKLPEEFRFKMFRTINKINRIRKRKTKYGRPYRVFKSISHVGKIECQCISTDAPDQLYITDDCIVTHNTIQSIAAVIKLDVFPCLIICPATLKLNWKKEIHKWTDKSVTVIDGLVKDVYEVINERKVLNGFETPKYDNNFTVINYDILERDKKINNFLNPKGIKILNHKDYLSLVPFKSIIIDESQFCINHKSLRTKAVKKISRKIKYRFALSGTPLLNKPKEFISQLDILDRLDSMGGFWEFAKRYCAAFEGPFGWDFSGASNLTELYDRLRKTCFIRRVKSEVLTELPDKQRILVPIDINNRAEYNKAKNNFMLWIKNKLLSETDFLEELKKIPNLTDSQRQIMAVARLNKQLNKTRSAQALVKIENLKQLVAKGKLPNVIDFIDILLQSNEKIIVYAKHKEIYNYLIKTYSDISVYIVGGMTSTQKDVSVERFQNDEKIKLFIGAIDSAGIGITLTKSSTVVFCEFGWTSAIHDQAEDRCHRIGQKDFVKCYYLYSEKTIDEDILSIIDKKRKIAQNVTDGIEFVDMDGNDNDIKEITSKFIE